MEYIAIGIARHEELESLGAESLAAKHDLELIRQTEMEIDLEVREGILSFAEVFRLNLIQVIKLSTKEKDSTSSGANDNLVDFFLGKTKSPKLIDFLDESKDLLPRKFYLIFAFEWHKAESVVYKNLRLDELEKHFRENNTWNLWLYNYQKGFFWPDLDVPLIIEVQNPIS